VGGREAPAPVDARISRLALGHNGLEACLAGLAIEQDIGIRQRLGIGIGATKQIAASHIRVQHA
jgi:hypothetical protein